MTLRYLQLLTQLMLISDGKFARRLEKVAPCKPRESESGVEGTDGTDSLASERYIPRDSVLLSGLSEGWAELRGYGIVAISELSRA